MKKIYVDMSCDKISGQQNMQRALLNQVKALDLYAEKEDADVLVYVQVKPDPSIVDEWKQFKSQGKEIVFIHHYMSKSFYERCAIFKIDGLFELIDYHIIISRESELFEYLIERGVDNSRIFARELATADYFNLYHKYFSSEKTATICYVGKIIKGLDKFVDFLEKHNIDDAYILCPDLHEYHYDRDLSKYHVYTDKKYDEVYEVMSKCKFIYCYSVYNTPAYHLETTLQEAIPCGCLPLVDDSYKKILKIDDLHEYGFVTENDLDIDDYTYHQYQLEAVQFQRYFYLTLNETINLLIHYLLSNKSVI